MELSGLVQSKRFPRW